MSRRPTAASSAEPAAPAVHTPRGKGSAVVTVACKIPNGLVLQLCKPTEYPEETRSGTVMRKRFDKFGERIIVSGPAYPNGNIPGFPARPMIVGGYALTPGVNAEFFAEWIAQNAKAPFVANKMIFGFSSLDETKGEAADHREVRSGFEPLALDKDPRMPKAAPGVGAIVAADEMALRTDTSQHDHFPAE